MPAHQLELALWLEADRMGSLLAALDEESMENQRDVVKNERRQRYDNVPYGTAFEKLTALAYPEGHPYHHTPIGSMADLDAASLEDARTFFRTYYAPNNAVLSVVGDIDPEQTLAWIEKYFGTIPAHDGKQPPRDGALPEVMGGQLREEIVEEVPARALMAAYRLPHDGSRECDAADVALTILGGGESSRLHNRLVRRDQSAVAAGFGLLRLAGAPSLGWLDVKTSSGIEVPAIEAAVDEELARFAAEGPTAEEMERAQAQLEREWLDRLSTVAWPRRRTVPLRGPVRRPAARPDRRPARPRRHRRGSTGRGRGPAAPRQPRGARVRAALCGVRRDRRDRERRGGAVSDTAAVTMTLHPQPQAGEAKPWAFPAPERGSLPNGLTLLRCHRPGQQVIAVEINLAAPLDAEPEGLDGVATIMARALSEGTDKHSAEEFAAELERCGATLDAHADHPGIRVSLEVPASRLAKALGLVAEALRAPPSRTARSTGWCATGSTRSRTSWPTRSAAPRRSSPRSSSRLPCGCPGPARAPRRRWPGSTPRPYAPSTRPTCAPPPPPRWSSAT